MGVIIHVNWAPFLAPLTSFTPLFGLAEARGFRLPLILGLCLRLELDRGRELAQQGHLLLLLSNFIFADLLVKLWYDLILLPIHSRDLRETASCLLLLFRYLGCTEDALVESVWTEDVGLVEQTCIEAYVELRVLVLPVDLDSSAGLIEAHLLWIMLHLMGGLCSPMTRWYQVLVIIAAIGCR